MLTRSTIVGITRKALELGLVRPGSKAAPAGPLLSNPQFAAMNTTFTNNMGADGFTWSQGYPILVDKFNKIVTTAESLAGDHKLVFSNDGGASWTDGATAYIVLTRGCITYDSTNDLIHALWSAAASTDGVIYRRYSITRDGSNNITAITQVAGVNLQMDFQGSGTMDYQHPVIMWLNDAAYAPNGAVVCIWSARNNAAPVGSELRASMRILSNNTSDNTAGNWVSLGANSTTGIGNAPSVAYTALATTTHNGGLWVSAYRKQAGTHAKDLYLVYGDPQPTPGVWQWRRCPWNSGSSNWNNTFTTPATISNIQRAGSDTGYGLKYQLGTKLLEDTGNDKIWVGLATWKDNVNGDTWGFVGLDNADGIGALVDVYSANGAHSYAPTGDLMFDATSSNLVASYLKTSGGGTYLRPYAASNGAAASSEVLVFNSSQTDIPLLWQGGRYGTSSPHKLLVMFRNTAATHLGFFGTMDWNG
jgi:hypothetical protein